MEGGVSRQRLSVYFISFSTTQEKKLIESKGDLGSSYTSDLVLRFQNGQMSERYGKALNHAVNLCGGKTLEKKEPF